MNTEKNHIYFIPGLAASPRIFDYIDLPRELYELHFLEWLVPESKEESIISYAQRMCEKITHPHPILVGVSFGGVIAQEINQILTPQKTIIISSIKNRNEMPSRMRFLQKTKTHKLFPTTIFANIEKYEKYIFADVLKFRIELYKKYLSMRDELYLPWAIHTVVNWQREISDPDIIHIHGTKDQVFPIKNIDNYIPVEGGTHIMVLDRARKISAILRDLLPVDDNHSKNQFKDRRTS